MPTPSRSRVLLIFQPAEEGGAGGRVMIEEGLLGRFSIEEVFGMHNEPGLPVGSFATRPGALMAAGDRFMVTLRGRGGHAASPHETPDPVLATAHLVTALQSIPSRFTNPLDPVVVSVTYLAAGGANALNVIRAAVQLGGTIRTVDVKTRRTVEKRFRGIVAATAKLFELEAEIEWRPGYPVIVDDTAMTREGAERVDGDCPSTMRSEDFSFMLEKRPGAFVWIGNGDTAGLHHPRI